MQRTCDSPLSRMLTLYLHRSFAERRMSQRFGEFVALPGVLEFQSPYGMLFQTLGEAGKHIMIVSKIENQQGIDV